ncbi:MAG: class I SAM-dependent RNA methyltransferase, partial [Verrucomicrobiota bacterium]|nr:class I SAM-dependent RNA methyltransferase [Verrucomicrobiota bacterium]
MPAPTPAPDPDRLAGFVLCRGGLEEVVVKELRELEIEVVARRKRAVEIVTNLAGFYRANMGLRSALNVLRPIRSFNARNYDLLYYQSRKTNWHKLFPVDARIRIDIKGHSPKITHTRYAIHRVKDGITDTFRKLCHGVRPSIEKRNPDVHVVVYLEKHRATLALDMSGTPLFKRGYRIEHGEAPMKEDLAAGLLSLSGWDRRSPLLDPMCGSGTLLFEAW